jgi:hypothetical protein
VWKNCEGAECVVARVVDATCVLKTGNRSVDKVSGSSACTRAGGVTKNDDAIGAA